MNLIISAYLKFNNCKFGNSGVRELQAIGKNCQNYYLPKAILIAEVIKLMVPKINAFTHLKNILIPVSAALLVARLNSVD